MGQINIPGTSITYSNPKQIDQKTLVFPVGMTTPGYPPNVNGTLAGVTWVQNGPTALPQPGSYDPTPVVANPVLFGQQPPSLSAGGINIPNSSVVLKNPS